MYIWNMIRLKSKYLIVSILSLWLLLDASAQTITLNIAISRGQKDEVANLLNTGYLPNGYDHKGNTPINVAVSYRQLDIFRLLCDYGADVNSVDEHGYFPLYLAANLADLSLTEAIIDQGAILDMTTDRGRTALIAAVRTQKKESLEIIKALQRNGADLNILDQYNRTALDYAELEDVRNFLQLHGAMYAKDL